MKFLSTLFAALLVSTSLSAFSQPDFGVEVGTGYRHDEVKGLFKNMNYVTLNGRLKVMGDCYYGRFDADYAWMINQNRRIDEFASDDSNIEIEIPVFGSELVKSSSSSSSSSYSSYSSSSYSSSSSSSSYESSSSDSSFWENRRKGHAYDFTVAVGYPISFECGQITVIPVIGYGYRKICQKSEFRFETDSSEPTVVPAEGVPTEIASAEDSLSSSSKESLSYVVDRISMEKDLKWSSMLVGVDIGYQMCSWNFYSELEYYPNFFQYKKYEQGFSAAVGADYDIDCDIYAGARIDYKQFWGKQHEDIKTFTARVELGYNF